jgi:hypothetical protein
MARSTIVNCAESMQKSEEMLHQCLDSASKQIEVFVAIINRYCAIDE